MRSKKNKEKHHSLTAVDITPKDDSFHGSMNYLDIEWWYFDAIFTNNYSIHVGIRTFHTKRHGIAKSRIEIYKNGKIEVEKIKTDLIQNLYISKDFPLIMINDKKVIEFNQEKYRKKGEWSYDVSLSIDDQEVNLNFTGTTKGWKIETSDTCWAVPLPKANVEGTITVNGKTMQVKGTGYHDHNWDYSITTAMNNIGWFWGRITGETLNVVWAKTMETHKKHNLLAIINRDKKNTIKPDEYISINPKNITFIPENFIYRDGRWIPTNFIFKIKEGAIDADIRMETIDIHHSRIFIAHYWRYHVKTNGYITWDAQTEKLNNKTQIIEFLSFKSHGKRYLEIICG
ncbi:MAG: hypothetical protein DRN05_01925 [Thermoplasmata archaeon]|nr:MAG: hypothetical protein DRN05_01925 [Thermoplasmata archaeon]